MLDVENEAALEIWVDVVGDREVRLRVPADCASEDDQQGGHAVAVPEEVSTVEVDDDGSFAIDESVEEDGTDGDVFHTEVRLVGRFTAEGTAGGTIDLSVRRWNAQAEDFDPWCRTGGLAWTADEPPQHLDPDAVVPLASDAMAAVPVGEDLLVLLVTR